MRSESETNPKNGVRRRTLIDRIDKRLESISTVLDYVDYIFDNAPKFKQRLTSSQSALVLRDLFDRVHYPDKVDDPRNPTERFFGAVAYREEEDPTYYTRYKQILEEYVKAEIKRYTGFTLDEYLNLTSYERYHIRDLCIECVRVAANAAKEAEKESKTRSEEMKNTLQQASGVDIETMLGND